jgi:succinate dehydrogenase hydrophobic anchor subunit
MRESTLRWVVYITGIAAFVLLAVHLIVVMLGPGSYESHLQYGAVEAALGNEGYFLALGALLVVVLVHGFLWLRRTLLDAHVGPRGMMALSVGATLTTGILLVLYATTVW